MDKRRKPPKCSSIKRQTWKKPFLLLNGCSGVSLWHVELTGHLRPRGASGQACTEDDKAGGQNELGSLMPLPSCSVNQHWTHPCPTFVF